MPDAMSARPPTYGLLWSALAAVVGLWLGYAVVAGMAQGTPSSPPTPTQPVPRSAPVGLALTPPPELRVRPALFAAGPVTAIATPTPTHRRRHRAAARPAAAAPAPAPAMSAPTTQTPITNPVTPTTDPAPTTPAQPTPTPAPRPVREQQPTIVAKPKPKPKPAPDFDDSAPSGFDNSG
jgi:hypothetical protein